MVPHLYTCKVLFTAQCLPHSYSFGKAQTWPFMMHVSIYSNYLLVERWGHCL